MNNVIKIPLTGLTMFSTLLNLLENQFHVRYTEWFETNREHFNLFKKAYPSVLKKLV